MTTRGSPPEGITTLSERMAGRAASTMRREFNVFVDVSKDVPYWRSRLAESGATDQNCGRVVKAFISGWDTNRTPCLHDLCKYFRQVAYLYAPEYEQWVANLDRTEGGHPELTADDARVGQERLKAIKRKIAGAFKVGREAKEKAPTPDVPGQREDVPDDEIPF